MTGKLLAFGAQNGMFLALKRHLLGHLEGLYGKELQQENCNLHIVKHLPKWLKTRVFMASEWLGL